MRRYLKLVVYISLMIFIVSGCTNINPKNRKYNRENTMEVGRSSDDAKAVVQPELQGYQLIASNSTKGIYIYGKKIDSKPYFNKVLVKTRTAQREFDWKATTKNPLFYLSDITGSGEDSIVVIFVTSYGTGIYETQVHIISSDLSREYTIEDPINALKRLVTARAEGQQIVFSSGGKEYRITPTSAPGGIQQALLNIQYGSIVAYNVENNRLTATVSVQTSPNSILGEFKLIYNFTGNKFVPQVVDFKRAG